MVKHGLWQRIKYVRRRASSSRAQGADCEGYRSYAQLVVEGLPYQKAKPSVAAGTLGLDLGPSTIAIMPQEGEARLLCFCEVVACGTTIITEHLSSRAWQKRDGKSVGAHAPRMVLEQVRGTGASNWRHPKARTHDHDPTVSGLPRLLREEAALATLA